jgi:hypothetical protein
MRVVFVSGKYIKTKDDNKREGVANVGWGKGYGLLMVWPWPCTTKHNASSNKPSFRPRPYHQQTITLTPTNIGNFFPFVLDLSVLSCLVSRLWLTLLTPCIAVSTYMLSQPGMPLTQPTVKPTYNV